MSMKYIRRTVLLILIWILLFIIVALATMYYGYTRSVETAQHTIESSLLKVDGSIEELIDDEIKIRDSYEQTHVNMGQVVPFLQEHGLEEAVPGKSHLKKYAELLGANYIAITDPDGKVAASSGKYVEDKHDIEISTEEQMHAWMTSADALLPAEEDYTLVVEPLEDGYQLSYQISNAEANQIQNETFSWRAILKNLTLPNEAYLVVISQQDDTILVHPDPEMVGKSYEALGFQSKEEFLNAYEKPDPEGIAYQKSMTSFLMSSDSIEELVHNSMNLMGRGSGYKEMQGMYVICNMPEDMSVFYLTQQRGVLIVYVLASLLVLCYILLHFRWQRRQEKAAQCRETAKNTTLESRLGFFYERVWSRRLIVCCIIVLGISAILAVHLELLSNSSQLKIQAAQAKKLVKEVSRQNEENRQQLDYWYNETNIQMANVITYVLTRDEALQTRDTLEEVALRFDVPVIYLFAENGKTRVTNSDYDHIDLNEDRTPRMSNTFLPLLYGMGENASTSATEDFAGTDGKQEEDDGNLYKFVEGITAYAGVSIRNSEGLCDGALGIGRVPLEELWFSGEYLDPRNDTFSTTLELAKRTDASETILLTKSQITLICIMLLFLTLCLALFCALGVLQRDPRKQKHKEAGNDIAGGEETPAGTDHMPAPGDPESDPIESTESDSDERSVQKREDLFYSIYGKEKDWFFNDRWNYDNIALRQRTPEKQLFFVIRCMLFVLFLFIVLVYITKGEILVENSMIRDIVSGDWKPGFNLYAITATEMIVIVTVVLCMGLRRLIYFIARFSTARGETVCHLVYSMIMYAAVLVAIYYSLSLFGVHAKTILAGAGILGIVISFGAQSTIADILSGMFLIFEDVIHVGDLVKVGDTIGIIKSTGVRMTKIQSFGTEISINNADLKAMNNMSSNDGRVSCYLPIDIHENLERVKQVIERELPGIIGRMNETGYITSDIWYSGVTSLDGAGFVLRFDVFCISYRFGRVQRQLNEELIQMCQRNDISIAVTHTYFENIDHEAKAESTARISDTVRSASTGTAGAVPRGGSSVGGSMTEAQTPAPPAKEHVSRKGFIDKLIEKADK